MEIKDKDIQAFLFYLMFNQAYYGIPDDCLCV